MGYIAQSRISGISVCHCTTGKVLFRIRGGVAYLLHEALSDKETTEKKKAGNAEQLIGEAEQLLRSISIGHIKVVLSTKAELTDAIFNASFFRKSKFFLDVKTKSKIVLSKLL